MLMHTHYRLMPLILLGVLGWASTTFPADSPLATVTSGEGALSFSAGFVRLGIASEGVVARTPDNKTILGKGDLVYLRMNKLDDVALDGLYTIFRKSQKVFHPANRRYLGDLINIVGIARITTISHEFAVVKIERSYGPIVPGNGVMAFAVPQDEPGMPGRSLPEIPGMIVEMQIQRSLIGQNHMVYLDWGREDGLAIGDRMDVFRVRTGLPDQSVGEVKVIALEDRTATGLIVRSTAPFALGDRFILKEAVGEMTQGESRQDESTNAQTHAGARPNAHQALTKSLEAEIARGDVSVRQEGDKVKINLGDLVSQLEYDPGQAPIKPTGLKILKQVSDILKTMTDQRIQVEGHTDSMPIGPSLVSRYPTNQALSEARANLIIRYFMEEGIDPSVLSAVGFADTKPVANNIREDGRRKNRRIEIELSPMPTSEPPTVPLSSNSSGAAIPQTSPNSEAHDSSPDRSNPLSAP